MTATEIRDFLVWSTVINYGVLFLWFGAFVFAHDWLYRAHARWFKLSFDAFDAINYAGVAVYKIGIILLNLVPLVAISIVMQGRIS